MSFSDSLLLLRIYDFVTSTLTLDKSQTLSLHVFHQEHGNYIYLPVWIVVKVECGNVHQSAPKHSRVLGKHEGLTRAVSV